jgi:hypothetical protein
MTKLPKLQLKKKILITTTLLAVFGVIGIATAQEIQRTYTVINPTVTHELNPGAYTQGTTKVINQSNFPLTFQIGVQDFIVTDTLGTPQILPPNTLSNKYSAAAWIGVSPSVFTLKPGQSQPISYYVQIPSYAKPGGHYAAIVYAPQSKIDGKATGGSVNTQIGSLFYLTVKGPIKESALVSKFFTNLLHEYGPVDILTQIRNMGDLHIMPKGTVQVTGLFFNKSQALPSRNIFPEAARDFTNTFGNWLMFGPYKAQLMATYGQNNNLPLVSTLYFWVFPWRLVIVIILVIVAVVLGTKYYKKRKEQHHKAPQEPTAEAKKEEPKADEGGNTTSK